MSRRSRCTERGDVLLESMISMIIVGLIVSGSVYTLARANKLQYHAALRAQVVDQLRALVVTQGVSLCGTTQALAVSGSAAVSASFSCQPYTGVVVALPGTSAITTKIGGNQAQMVTATVESAILGGSLSVSSGAKDGS